MPVAKPAQRDRLFLLQPGFRDPAYPDQAFYCWHCALMEGVLASFPDLARNLDVMRIAWPRPRAAVVALVGEAYQSVPLLVLGEGGTEDPSAALKIGRHGDVRFIDSKDEILKALSLRHGFPNPHP